ncbi:MAG: hypothetical protein MJ219_01740 [Mycoplasmoidaceae bacterium]|nr:hypothetical protein [Mycoplasmoidaceae bacterium]
MSIFASTVPEGLDKACYYVGTGFSCFYGLTIIFLIAIIVATCIKNHRPAFHDKYSNIYIISLKTEEINKITTKKHIHENSENDFPGVISSESFEEIENL